jgi:hypothetical protein
MNKDLTPAEEEVLRGMTVGYQVERRDGSDDGYWAAVVEERLPSSKIDSRTMKALREKGYLQPSTDGTRWIFSRRARDIYGGYRHSTWDALPAKDLKPGDIVWHLNQDTAITSVELHPTSASVCITGLTPSKTLVRWVWDQNLKLAVDTTHRLSDEGLDRALIVRPE